MAIMLGELIIFLGFFPSFHELLMTYFGKLQADIIYHVVNHIYPAAPIQVAKRAREMQLL